MEVLLALDRNELKKLLKEKGVKSLDDFNVFMRQNRTDSTTKLLHPFWTRFRGAPQKPINSIFSWTSF